MSILESERVQELLDRAGLGGVGPGTLRIVIATTAALAVLGLWRFWPAAPAPEVAFDQEQTPAAAAEDAEARASDEATSVVVHVAGAVMRPGVYALPLGSRVTDAIASAGGGIGDAALDTLNLARILSDGEQVYVATAEQVASGAGPPVPSGGGASGGASGGLVDLNTATAEELDGLPGVGPSTAQKIVDDREANGPFATPEDLMRVSGIGAKKFEALKDLVTCR